MRKPILNRRLIGLAEVTLVALYAAIFSAFGGPMMDDAREKARQTACMNNQRQIVLAILMYCQDNDEVLPKAETCWGDIRVPREVTTCLNAPALVNGNGYVYNSSIAGKELGDPIFRDATTLFVTADGQHIAADGATPNLAFTLADLDTMRHSFDGGETSRFIASYLDGHVDTTTADGAKGWLPK